MRSEMLMEEDVAFQTKVDHRTSQEVVGKYLAPAEGCKETVEELGKTNNSEEPIGPCIHAQEMDNAVEMEEMDNTNQRASNFPLKNLNFENPKIERRGKEEMRTNGGGKLGRKKVIRASPYANSYVGSKNDKEVGSRAAIRVIDPRANGSAPSSSHGEDPLESEAASLGIPARQRRHKSQRMTPGSSELGSGEQSCASGGEAWFSVFPAKWPSELQEVLPKAYVMLMTAPPVRLGGIYPHNAWRHMLAAAISRRDRR